MTRFFGERILFGIAASALLAACTVGKDGAPGAPGVPCAGCVNSASLASGAVTSLALAPGAVTATQLAPGAVSEASIAPGTFSAGPGLVVSGTQFSANLLPPGGPNGTATTLARSDHSHQLIKGASTNPLTMAGVSIGPGTTNLIALSYTAPASGNTWASATGFCEVIAAPTAGSGPAVTIDTSATPQGATATGGWVFLIPANTQPPALFPFAVTRLLPASAGSNSVYLNYQGGLGGLPGGTIQCWATMTAFFTETLLP